MGKPKDLKLKHVYYLRKTLIYAKKMIHFIFLFLKIFISILIKYLNRFTFILCKFLEFLLKK
jgi:hypothetical protein